MHSAVNMNMRLKVHCCNYWIVRLRNEVSRNSSFHVYIALNVWFSKVSNGRCIVVVNALLFDALPPLSVTWIEISDTSCWVRLQQMSCYASGSSTL